MESDFLGRENKLLSQTIIHLEKRNGLQNLLDDVPFQDRVNMWFMQDGAVPHYVLLVRQWLAENFPERWIRRGVESPQFWSRRSPDLNPLDFYLWGELKQSVYSCQVLYF
ncbi:hypothetical protein NQ318_017381 [Aromia moschata]|uniref:Transposable element Tc3 transposase n=1 Tax=Aromia moschata TaxID=1265417 RepID=A0AAV8Z501_9CUCU|nr:hypothetical protein NQ318_017381 [Aromia moschata]